MTMTSKLDAATLRTLAVRVSADPRTVRKVLRGEPVRGLTGQRVRAELAKLGCLSDYQAPPKR